MDMSTLALLKMASCVSKCVGTRGRMTILAVLTVLINSLGQTLDEDASMMRGDRSVSTSPLMLDMGMVTQDTTALSTFPKWSRSDYAKVGQTNQDTFVNL